MAPSTSTPYLLPQFHCNCAILLFDCLFLLLTVELGDKK
uniref:Uncharacterized protein n=1 Tax=Rhizophora mucronata TaxID=61149 RepID=A0A2P2Q0Q8_RHIMU